MLSLICTWINGWANNHEAGDLRCQCAHYDVTVMQNTMDVILIIIKGPPSGIMFLFVNNHVTLILILKMSYDRPSCKNITYYSTRRRLVMTFVVIVYVTVAWTILTKHLVGPREQFSIKIEFRIFSLNSILFGTSIICRIVAILFRIQCDDDKLITHKALRYCVISLVTVTKARSMEYWCISSLVIRYNIIWHDTRFSYTYVC